MMRNLFFCGCNKQCKKALRKAISSMYKLTKVNVELIKAINIFDCLIARNLICEYIMPENDSTLRVETVLPVKGIN